MPTGIYERTPEHRAAISAAMKERKGHPCSEETRTKISVAKRGNTNTRLPIGSTHILGAGYRWVKVAQPSEWQQEHRVIMGIASGDPQIVHHTDGDPLNNDPTNLEVMSRAEHDRLHTDARAVESPTA